MKALAIMILLFICATTVWADETACPETLAREIPSDTTVFFYQRVKDGKVTFLPIIALRNNQLESATGMLLPKEVLMFNLRDSSRLTVHFKNIPSETDPTQCISVGHGDVISNNCRTPDLYATVVIAPYIFTFPPSADNIKRFNKTVVNPCKPGDPRTDKYGIAICSTDQLIATSYMQDQTQFWHTKQYKYDVGFAVSTGTENSELTEIARDCSLCSD